MKTNHRKPTPPAPSARRLPSTPDADENEADVRAEAAALLGALSHAAKNQLAAARGAIETVLPATGLSDGERVFLRDALSGVSSTDRLLRAAAGFARVQPLRPTIFDAGALLREIALFVADRTRRQKVHVSCDPPSVPVEADRGEVAQAILHLVTNALDAMPSGGTLALSCSSLAHPNGSWAEWTVEDSGPGIPEPHRARAEEPFFTTKPNADGLGLSSARRAAIRHGGSLALSFGPGTRATFRVPSHPKARA